MAVSTTPRRALQDLPVNAHRTPTLFSPSLSSNTNMKRFITEVEDPAAAPPSSRLRLSEQTESLHPKLIHPHSAPMAEAPLEKAGTENQDGTKDESTQETGNDTVSTFENSDTDGDTLSTQQTTATEFSQATDTGQISHAERLRLRLRIALFKVQTNQINIPMSQLCIPSPRPLDEAVPHRHTSQPTLLPAPVLKPSIHHCRTVKPSHVLSSPPGSSEASPELFRTPALPRQRVPAPQPSSSSPDGQDGGARRVEAERNHLSSSAVKGYAARSLLGLREERQ